MKKAHKIIVIGGSWHGSDSLGLARGFRELGCSVELIGLDEYFPRIDRSLYARIIKCIMRPFYRQQFNKYIVHALETINPDIIVAFKGSWIQLETIKKMQACDAWLCNFYPDVSFMCHKSLNIQTFSYYDHIFTTKSFGIKDFADHLGLKNVSFLPHGYDPSVHRPLNTKCDSELEQDIDISFIGTWSPHKENILSAIALKLPAYTLRIWGNQWEKCTAVELQSAIVGQGITGDFYALAIGKSKINLGLLSEKRVGASQGDQITSRTFHIPACGGFLLHERTAEVLTYFDENKDICCFSSVDELVEKLLYYLNHERERLQIARSGYERCLSENSLTVRAQAIIEYFENTGLCA